MGKSLIKKKEPAFSPESILDEVIKNLKKDNLAAKGTNYNILDFAKECIGINLFEPQKIIMKFLYGGTRFNEHLDIDEKDMELIKQWEIPQTWITDGEGSNKSKIDIFKEFRNSENPTDYFRDLVLVLGRRSGKSFLSALISVYEAYKLITFDNPQAYYGIDDDIYIINTAITGDQAETIIFKQIRKFVNKCPFFEGRVQEREESGAPTIHILTNKDIEENDRIKKAGGKPLEGSIVLRCGNSNSPALRGHSAVAVIYDEMAHYVDTKGRSSADEVYNALSRSTLNFRRKGDGRNIAISSPNMASGFFYKHFLKAKIVKNMMLFQLKTWDANPTTTKESVADDYEKDPETADAEFGAMFRRSSGQNYFPPDKIVSAVNRERYLGKVGIPGYEYYMHIDPAKNSDKWAVMIVHPEYRYIEKLGQRILYIVEDYSKFFCPKGGEYLDPDKIMDNDILPLFDKFRIVSVTADGMFTYEQIKKLKNKSINFRPMSFGGNQKNLIYDTTRDLLINERIELCADDVELEGELMNVVVDYSKSPISINKNPNSEYPDDDVVDCLVGNVQAIMMGATGRTKLPKTSTVYTGRR